MTQSRIAALLAANTPNYATTRSFPRLTPMQRVVNTLNDNIKFLKDPTYTVSTPHGKKRPVPCFKINGNAADVWIQYLSKKVDLANDNGKVTPSVTVKADKVEDALQDLIEGVKAGDLDKTLQRMFDEKRAKEAAAK